MATASSSSASSTTAHSEEAVTTTPASTSATPQKVSSTSVVAVATSSRPSIATLATAALATGVVTLRWVFGDMDQGRAKLLDKVAAQFEQSHPGVKVQAELSSALETSIPTWAASGTLYDVFFNLTNMIAARAAKEMTVPLDPFIARDHHPPCSVQQRRDGELHVAGEGAGFAVRLVDIHDLLQQGHVQESGRCPPTSGWQVDLQ
ncbi:MAG: hypothetical protein M1118_12205 [Chloroflexi bacterium]|nr:hypothetical protein [Chloroflexota bacterium]